MKITLKAANNFYVSAELGGGIDTRGSTMVAVRANRVEASAWETFDVEWHRDGVALKTSEGYYLTAEGGGGSDVRTNATTVGPWEMFTPIVHAEPGDLVAAVGLRTWDEKHFLCAEVGSSDPVVNATRTSQGPWETFEVTVVEGSLPQPVNLRQWKGAFCIPDALPGIPFGDGHRIWTPAYGCYDTRWRQAIRDAYVARGYTHFVYNCAGLPYSGEYPELADDPMRVNRDLIELGLAGLVPVVVATDDRYPDIVLESFKENAPSIVIAFPCWEQNGPLDNDEGRQKRLIDAVKEAAPTADLYLHFTPGHGSISYQDEVAGWHWCEEHGTLGLLGQGPNRISGTDPLYEGRGFETTAARLAGDVGYVVPDWDGSAVPPSWGGLHQLAVKFEWGIYESYYGGLGEAALQDYTAKFLSVAPHVAGYCDGGPKS